jgi:hypothetical protein
MVDRLGLDDGVFNACQCGQAVTLRWDVGVKRVPLTGQCENSVEVVQLKWERGRFLTDRLVFEIDLCCRWPLSEPLDAR